MSSHCMGALLGAFYCERRFINLEIRYDVSFKHLCHCLSWSTTPSQTEGARKYYTAAVKTCSDVKCVTQCSLLLKCADRTGFEWINDRTSFNAILWCTQACVAACRCACRYVSEQYDIAPFVIPHTAGRGVHTPWGNDAFLPVSHFPLFPKKISDSAENFPDLTFSQKKFRFSSAKISDNLLSLTTNFEFPLYFPCFDSFSPLISGNFSFPLTFAKFPPDFIKLTCFYILYMYFVSPYFYQDAFMHHTMHVLDASDGRWRYVGV